MQLQLPPAPWAWAPNRNLHSLNWDSVPALPPFTLWDGSSPARWQTRAQACANDEALFVHFDCEDDDIWGNYTQRDDAIYDEEVVEVFIGAGENTPTDYFEFEISPNGVLFDARIHNTLATNGHRAAALVVETAWDCAAVQWIAARFDEANRWRAAIAIPWRSLLVDEAVAVPKIWRGNFYRIERPRSSGTAEHEYSAWSPPLGAYPDFHRAGEFGTIVR
jgi:hypothetical protein